MPPSTNTGAILGLGTAVFVPGYGVDRRGLTAEDPCALLRSAFARGVKYVDTASGYGASEHWLGQVRDLLDSKQVRVCTKLAARYLADGPAESIRRLRCDRLDTLLLHSAGRSDLLDPRVEAAMNAAKADGLVSRCGASTYGAEDACLALEQAWCDVVQVEFSILNPSVVRGLVSCRRPDQEVVVRSVLGQGMLTVRRREGRHLGDRAVAVLDALDAQAREWSMSLEHLAIRFALDTAGIDVVLVGISNQAELDAALAAATGPALEPRQLASLSNFNCSREDWTHPERWAART